MTLQTEIAAVTHERNQLKSRVPPEGGTLALQHTVTKLREQYEQKQGRVTALEQEVASLIRERDSLKVRLQYELFLSHSDKNYLGIFGKWAINFPNRATSSRTR